MFRPSNPQRAILPPQLWRLRPFQLVVIDLYDWLFPWVIINLLWVLCSLTVVLLPPATGALFQTAQRAYRNQPPDPRRFMQDLRVWFSDGWLWALPNVALFGGLFLLGRALAPAEIPLAVLGVVATLSIMLQFFFWPYMMLQEQPALLRAWRNSAFTALGDLLYAGLYLAFSLFVLVTSIVVVAPLVLITPVLLAMTATYGLAAWLEHHKLLDGDPRQL